LAAVPETPARLQHELDLLTALALALRATKSPAAPELEPVLTRAIALAQQVGTSAQYSALLRARWAFYNVRLEHQAAHAVAEQLLDLAQHQHDPPLLLRAHHALGVTCANMGLFALARTHHEQGIALADAQRHTTPHTVPGSLWDHGVSFRAMVAWVLWELGYPDQAVQRGQEALGMAHALAHPFTLVEVLRYGARLHALRREWHIAPAHAETLWALATEHGFARYVAFGAFFRGWALAAQGHGVEGIAQMHQSLDASRALGGVNGLEVPALAEAYGQVGQVDEGLHLLVEEPARVGTTGGRHRAERHRLRGELLLRQAVTRDRRPQPASSRPLTWRASSRPNRGSCGPP
jgi:tetratricopeptide (TPR) repeat protein